MLDNPFFQFGEFCEGCKRWYNPSSPHICDVGIQDKVTERKKIVRWLGDSLKKVHSPS
jgi:hypothetical protein